MTNRLIQRRLVLQGAAALGGAALFTEVAAQAGKAWPSKPIRMVVPFNAGGGTDFAARVIGEALAQRLGQPVVVDNKGGASGILGTDTVAKAPADGHTLLLSLSTTMLINQFLYTKLPYNPQKDLTLISQVATGPVTLVAHPSVPASNMKELLQWLKANKGKVSYGSWGMGSYAHLAGAYMSKATASDMVHSAYKGEAPMIQDLIGGQIQLCFASAQNTKDFIENGRLKAIGVTGMQRMAILPKVPTIHEQGVQDDAYSIVGWVAMGAPAGLPQPIVDTLSAHLREIAKDPKVLERLRGAGLPPLFNGPQEFQQNYRRDMPVWKKLVEDAEARLD